MSGLAAILADNAGIGRKRNSGRRLDFVGLRIYAPNASSGAARVAKRGDKLSSCRAGIFGRAREVCKEAVVFIKRLQKDGWS